MACSSGVLPADTKATGYFETGWPNGEMMAHCKITVVTPSYNQGQYLEQTMRSVLEQDYPHKEYMVIDGGSSDASVDIIKRYADRLTYWCSEKDQGQADAIAKGFERATGDILCWINSDDILLPGALRAVADYFTSHPSVEVVSGGAYYIDEKGKPFKLRLGTYSFGVAATYGRFKYYAFDGVFQQATFWRRAAYTAVGGINRELNFIMDRDLFIRLAGRKRFGRLPKLLACFRLHAECKSTQLLHVRADEDRSFARRYGRDAVSGTSRRLLYWRYRIPSLIRKMMLMSLRAIGAVRLERIQPLCIESDGAAMRRRYTHT